MLERYGFDVCSLYGATRIELLDALDEVVDQARSDAAYVWYFSGHAFDCQFHGGLGRSNQKTWHYLATCVDEDDFNGILDFELSERLHRLAEVSDNLTIVLDCCRGEDIVRNGAPRPPAVRERPRDFDRVRRSFERWMNRAPFDVDHPRVIRLTASTSRGDANEDRRTGGLMTAALSMILGDPGRAQPWAVHYVRLLERVRTGVARDQWPTLRGPRGRIPFSFDYVEVTTELSVAGLELPRFATIRGGRMHGLELGAELRFPQHSGHLHARVTEATGAWVRVELLGDVQPRVGDLAQLTATPSPLEVALVGHPPALELLRGRLETSARLREDPAAPLVVTATSVSFPTAGVFTLTENGVSIRESRAFSELDTLIEDLEALARVPPFLRALEEAEPDLGWRYDWRWELRRRRGSEQLIVEEGELLHHGDQISLYFDNTSDSEHSNLYFNLFDLGLAGKLALMTQPYRTGLEVERGRPRTLYDGSRPRSGCVIRWPREVPREGNERKFELICVISDQPLDLSAVTANRGRGLTPMDDQERWPFEDERTLAWTIQRRKFRLSYLPRLENFRQ